MKFFCLEKLKNTKKASKFEPKVKKDQIELKIGDFFIKRVNFAKINFFLILQAPAKAPADEAKTAGASTPAPRRRGQAPAQL